MFTPPESGPTKLKNFVGDIRAVFLYIKFHCVYVII